jgi:hypothetical protein
LAETHDARTNERSTMTDEHSRPTSEPTPPDEVDPDEGTAPDGTPVENPSG